MPECRRTAASDPTFAIGQIRPFAEPAGPDGLQQPTTSGRSMLSLSSSEFRPMRISWRHRLPGRSVDWLNLRVYRPVNGQRACHYPQEIAHEDSRLLLRSRPSYCLCSFGKQKPRRASISVRGSEYTKLFHPHQLGFGPSDIGPIRTPNTTSINCTLLRFGFQKAGYGQSAMSRRTGASQAICASHA